MEVALGLEPFSMRPLVQLDALIWARRKVTWRLAVGTWLHTRFSLAMGT